MRLGMRPHARAQRSVRPPNDEDAIRQDGAGREGEQC
jgi:hypothetical protein